MAMLDDGGPAFYDIPTAPDGASGTPKHRGKDWNTGCRIRGQQPTVHPAQLGGPYCFGEAEAAGGIR
ncbi:hypothetical protein [Bordetella pseudohinzii]|uniref:Uncharacterized protein n=1 Tax=Bordetella pseudohinzii TaxID=1331258 RepID=A0A0J6C1E3_9BORD|nr:hypothetical protein [Bordetella pseudohinzii]ANY17243.1 hypothetical protein BBN53_15980 [Bordetella pseudohinzii]KMM24863.1 hypothetical protein L540_03275 [Bordetella pseudohinzii]KXA75363.1 hypothetical protein AW877_20200 [Bordetella pseudohinzii]KXA75567.1 hypothetical protein AW878_19865 [Bordetella pseudohinzii]CUI96923.1 Uncharacterised protein [Bordetella pseudohinzii]